MLITFLTPVKYEVKHTGEQISRAIRLGGEGIMLPVKLDGIYAPTCMWVSIKDKCAGLFSVVDVEVGTAAVIDTVSSEPC